MKIHPTALIDPTTEVGDGVEVGAYTVVGPHCSLGRGTAIGPHVVIEEFTSIGEDCQIRAGSVLGGPPQDRKFKGERSFLHIGSRNLIREFVTMHRSADPETATVIGDDNLIMAYVHIGHNCQVGSGITMANNVGLSGHVTVEDGANIGGFVGVHQFVRIGRLAIIGGYSKVVQDVPPFMLADGRPAKVLDLNKIGLRRADVRASSRAAIRNAYKLLYRSNLNVSQALETINETIEPNEELNDLVEFMGRIKEGSSGRQNDRPRR
jgi:UDP-N-acetylglucosamine acyltransferase